MLRQTHNLRMICRQCIASLVYAVLVNGETWRRDAWNWSLFDIIREGLRAVLRRLLDHQTQLCTRRPPRTVCLLMWWAFSLWESGIGSSGSGSCLAVPLDLSLKRCLISRLWWNRGRMIGNGVTDWATGTIPQPVACPTWRCRRLTQVCLEAVSVEGRKQNPNRWGRFWAENFIKWDNYRLLCLRRNFIDHHSSVYSLNWSVK